MTDLFRAGMTDLLARGWRTLARVGVAGPLLAWGCGSVLHGAGEAWTVLGAQLGEIPAASAGMTELARAGVAELACVGVAELERGAGEAWTGLGAQRGEIPAASAGMTDLLARV